MDFADNHHNRAKSSKVLLVDLVVENGSSKTFETRDFLEAMTNQEVQALRTEIAGARMTGQSLYSCGYCLGPVSLSTSLQPSINESGGLNRHSWHFRHYTGDGACDGGRLSKTMKEILASKFNGQEEGEEHKRYKSLVVRSLKADPRFDDVREERRFAKIGSREWRRPDVSASIDNMGVAFEVQLSTTFLHVVMGRETFYSKRGMALLWLLPKFDSSARRQVDEDILNLNNSNVFCIDEESTIASERAGQLMLQCWYREAFLENGQLKSRWKFRIVAWSSLKIDLSKGTVIFHDYEAQLRRLARVVIQPLAEIFCGFYTKGNAENQPCRARPIDTKILAGLHLDLLGAPTCDLNELNGKMRQFKLQEFRSQDEFIWIMSLIKTAKAGRTMIKGNPNLISYSHALLNFYPEYFRAFLKLLKCFGKFHVLEQDNGWNKLFAKWKAMQKPWELGQDRAINQQIDALLGDTGI